MVHKIPIKVPVKNWESVISSNIIFESCFIISFSESSRGEKPESAYIGEKTNSLQRIH